MEDLPTELSENFDILVDAMFGFSFHGYSSFFITKNYLFVILELFRENNFQFHISNNNIDDAIQYFFPKARKKDIKIRET